MPSAVEKCGTVNNTVHYLDNSLAEWSEVKTGNYLPYLESGV